MKILIATGGLTEDRFGGVEYHRIIAPFNHLAMNGWDVTHTPHLEDPDINVLKQFDICVFNRNISPKLDPKPVFQALKVAGVKTVIDVDDYWHLDEDHVLSRFYDDTNISQCIADQIKVADMVWCTHKQLARKIRQELGVKKVWSIANGIDPMYQPQFQLDNNEHEYDHVFYQGSVTHYHDLRLIAPAINQLGAKMTIAGTAKDNEWARVRKLFTNLNEEPARPVNQYAELYYNKGIAVIPLRDTMFNNMKSELKMIEAGWFSKAVAVSDVYPYTRLAMDGKNCLKVEHDWKGAIKRLLESKQLQDDLRGLLHENVRNRYMMDDLNKTRIEALNELYAKG